MSYNSTVSSSGSSSNFQFIFEAALADYLEQTEVDLTKHFFTEKLRSCQSADAILELLQDKANKFKDYRNGNRKLINCLKPVVQVFHAFSGILGGVASVVPFQPTNLIFSGIYILLGAAIEVGTSYDALVDLFECVVNFLNRLHIYTEIPSTPSISRILITIMVKVLSVFALATKQIKQGRFSKLLIGYIYMYIVAKFCAEKFAKKLLGESEIEAVMQRLNRLTDDEARMTAAQTLQVVHGLVNNVKVVMDDGKASTSDIRQSLTTMQEMTNGINRIERDQLQRDIRSWLSPPNPSTNHNIAWEDHRRGSATWFTQGSLFDEWTSTGSLLWIHGKPGSGKSVLCSSIIQEVKEKCDSGLALMGYYYFDFRDTTKQDIRGLLTSLLAQLCAESDSCHHILSELYSRNNAGSRQPDIRSLTECLKEMLQLPRQPMIYIIVDALDECPNSSGFPNTARDKVLSLLEELLESNISSLRIWVTSRPEVDVRDVLEPLASHHLSLHDENGQKNDIVSYISSVVLTDRKMRRWRSEEKQLVISTLSEKADGMFRWVVCQLEMLRRCFPPSLRDALNELPETLDETYERILLGIDKEKREYAHRLLQCVAVAMRPLAAEELAEILAMRFDSGEIPHYHIDWRQDDSREAVLSACSSLVVVVNVDGSSIVQFSHFSVLEFLTSHRLVEAPANLSRYHIDFLSAHTILAQVSLSVLFHLGDSINKKNIRDFPFAIYAAQHWVDHGRFEGVSSSIRDTIGRLFDADNPSFATWLWIHDIDYPLKEHMSTPHPTRPEAVPLYYATLCGFRDVVEHLLVAPPEGINARGGYHTTPFHAALAKGNFEIAILLLEHDADVDALDHYNGEGALHIASRDGRCDNVKFLLEHHADVNVVGKVTGKTPLGLAASSGELKIVVTLLGHGAVVNYKDGCIPLFAASRYGHLDVVQLLIRSGAALDSSNNGGQTPLFAASAYGHLDIVRSLIQSGATVDSRDNNGQTPLFAASARGHLDILRSLIQSGATIDPRANDGCTPLNVASGEGHPDIVRLLIQSGAAMDSQDINGCHPLLAAATFGHLDTARLLMQCGAAADYRDINGLVPLMLASQMGHLEIAQELLNQTSSHQPGDLKTSLNLALAFGHLSIVALLIPLTGIEIQIEAGQTPLNLASSRGHLEIVRWLLKNGSNKNAQDIAGCTPLHNVVHHGHIDVVKMLLESGADIDVRNRDDKTPFDVASASGKWEVAKILSKGAGVDFGDDRRLAQLNSGSQLLPRVVMPSSMDPELMGFSLHTACMADTPIILQLLLDCGAVVNKRDDIHDTPLAVASKCGSLEIARILVKNGADVNSKNKGGWPPLHYASRNGHLDIVRLLLDEGADVNAKEQDHWSALHLASVNGYFEIVQLLLERGAKVDMKNDQGRTPSDEALRLRELKIVGLLSQAGAR